MTNDELIAKLEAAERGSRGLDGCIAAHVGFQGWTPQEWQDALNDPRMQGQLYPDYACPDRAPEYTTSLDAAMTLLTDDAFWRVGHDGEGQNPGDFRADVMIGRVRAHFIAATAPLAMAGAALKARATMKE